MARVDCWIYTGCAREPGGRNADALGVCPASTETRLNGANHGTNGGRACWAIAGTFCDGEVQGSHATKIATCLSCPFYNRVHLEEGQHVMSTTDILLRLIRTKEPPTG